MICTFYNEVYTQHFSGFEHRPKRWSRLTTFNITNRFIAYTHHIGKFQLGEPFFLTDAPHSLPEVLSKLFCVESHCVCGVMAAAPLKIRIIVRFLRILHHGKTKNTVNPNYSSEKCKVWQMENTRTKAGGNLQRGVPFSDCRFPPPKL